MNDFEKADVQFDEKDIEQIFGGDAVLSDVGNSVNETQVVRQVEQQKQQAASDNLS